MKIYELSDAEKYIMDQFWQHGTMTGPAVAELVSGKEWKRTTLYTFLSRLTAKGMLRAEKSGTASVYVPLVTKQAYQSTIGQKFLDEQYGGRAKDFLASMISEKRLSENDIKELQDWFTEQGGR